MTDAESIGRRRRADALRNRSAIVEAANRELIEGANLTMQAVAAAAGVSRSTLHRHFPTRTDLDRAVREECLETARSQSKLPPRSSARHLASRRRLVGALVGVGAERCLEAVDALPAWRRGREDSGRYDADPRPCRPSRRDRPEPLPRSATEGRRPPPGRVAFSKLLPARARQSDRSRGSAVPLAYGSP